MSETQTGRNSNNPARIYDDSVRRFIVEAAPHISRRKWNAETEAILSGIKRGAVRAACSMCFDARPAIAEDEAPVLEASYVWEVRDPFVETCERCGISRLVKRDEYSSYEATTRSGAPVCGICGSPLDRVARLTRRAEQMRAARVEELKTAYPTEVGAFLAAPECLIPGEERRPGLLEEHAFGLAQILQSRRDAEERFLDVLDPPQRDQAPVDPGVPQLAELFQRVLDQQACFVTARSAHRRSVEDGCARICQDHRPRQRDDHPWRRKPVSGRD